MGNLITKFNGVSIAFQGNDKINLTDLWRAAESDEDKRPNDWMAIDSNQKFIHAVSNNLNTAVNGIIKTTRGKGGGTWAHWQIALAYAKYLSPELHMYVNQVFKERLDEEKNPELAYSRGRERAISGWKKQGREEGWISNRLKGIEQRKVFTSILGKHGVTNAGYGKCTDSIHEPLLGKPTHIIKQELGIKKGDSIRNHVGNIENIGIMLAEALAGENIEKRAYHGTEQCSRVCYDASSSISRAIRESRAVTC